VSIDVALDDLARVIAGRGPLAYLVTVGAAGPRVVSASVEVDGVDLVMAAGRHSLANVADRPSVTLLWPPDEGDPAHSLLVDGTARPDVDGTRIRVAPTSAILHRVRTGRGRP
jgi:hypothetical protein